MASFFLLPILTPDQACPQGPYHNPRQAYERPAANPDQSPVLIRTDGAVTILAPGGTFRISKVALILLTQGLTMRYSPLGKS